MTQMNGKASPLTTNATPAVAAALHRQNGKLRLVVLANRNGVSLVEARTLDKEAGLDELLTQMKVERLIRVAPAKETVARCASVPAGTAEELGAAASLLAEAQLPESIASHRRAAGIVPQGDGSGGRMALLVGWQGDAGAKIGDEIEETWTTPAASLAALRQGVGSAVYADAEEGSISLLAFGTTRSVARVLLESAPTAGVFSRSVGVVVGETCNAAGATVPAMHINTTGIILSLDPASMAAAIRLVTGVPDKKDWFEQYGIALGAAIIALSKDPLLRPLASMKAAAPVKRQSIPERTVTWLSRPRNAWGLLAASIAVVFLGPLAIAEGRLSILESKSVGLGDKKQERAESAKRSAMNKQLESSRWPMTKLLGDISGAMPVGVITESIRLASDQGLAIQGSAESADLINKMQENLNATKLLANVKLNKIETVGSSVEFDLTADVVNPYLKAAGVEDFASKPLAVRLYGDGALNTTMPKNRGKESSSSSQPTRTTSRGGDRPERSGNGGGGGGGGGAGERADRGSRTSEAPKTPTANAAPGEAPPPLTDDQIKKMDKPTATKEWVSRKTFPQKNPSADAATKSRLDEEVRKLREQMDKATAGAPK